MNISSQAQDNREYVRRLLKERQPDFAVVLESVVRALSCQMCRGPGLRHRRHEKKADSLSARVRG
jgi:hypothetical protein